MITETKNVSETKCEKARDILAQLKRVLVAFSGGVDSSVLLKLAIDVLGKENVLAVTATGPLHPKKEKDLAAGIAQLIGANHLFIQDVSCKSEEFLKNTLQRCYYCKLAMLERLKEVAAEHRLNAIIAGENADDQLDYRPGSKAMLETGVRCPLKEAYITKKEIRELARGWGLPNYDAPPSPCLATRVAYGQSITSELLEQIDQAETFLHNLGFNVVRVRVHGPLARIEVGKNEISRFMDETLRNQVLEEFKGLGFHFTSLDLAGYEMGGLNKLIDTTAHL